MKVKKEKISIDLPQRIRSLRDESLKSERIWAGFGGCFLCVSIPDNWLHY